MPEIHVVQDGGLIRKVRAGVAEAELDRTVSLEQARQNWMRNAHEREDRGQATAVRLLTGASTRVGTVVGSLLAKFGSLRHSELEEPEAAKAKGSKQTSSEGL